jgi:hypothetical protein
MSRAYVPLTNGGIAETLGNSPHTCPNCGAAMTGPGRLEQQLAAYNTTWQHDPPQVGDTK